MATFATPCVVAIGVSSKRVIYLEVESGRRIEELVGVDVDSAEPAVGEFIKGHIALASFSTTIVKGVALYKSAYILDASGLRPLAKRAVTLNSVKAREFGAWEQVWNLPIFLSQQNPTVAVGASRAGSLFHINAVPSDIELAEKIWASARVLQKAGEFSINCTCRLGVMPVEVFARNGNRYIVAKFYLNITSPRSRKVFLIAGEGGNVIERREVEVDGAEIAAYDMLKHLA